MSYRDMNRQRSTARRLNLKVIVPKEDANLRKAMKSTLPPTTRSAQNITEFHTNHHQKGRNDNLSSNRQLLNITNTSNHNLNDLKIIDRSEKPRHIKRSTLAQFFSRRRNENSRSSKFNDVDYNLTKITNLSSIDLDTVNVNTHSLPPYSLFQFGELKE